MMLDVSKSTIIEIIFSLKNDTFVLLSFAEAVKKDSRTKMYLTFFLY